MKLFGIGLNKTGTKTLGECFTILGFKNKSFDLDLLRSWFAGDVDAILRAADQFDSFEDWPWPMLFREFDQAYPDAKFILTLRKDSDTWYDSLCKHADLTGPTEARKIVYGHEMPHNHKGHHIDFYLDHNESVVYHFRNRPEKLLVVSWENGDGWDKLCNFLHCPQVPGIPFPHKNSSQSR